MKFEQLGPYRLNQKLGQGGMGAVYQGVDTQSGQPAAVKVLSPHLASEAGFRIRFEAEIESLKKLRHPNIVRLYGYGEQGGTLFYAMELVEGTSLEDELRDGRRFEWREVTLLTIKLCRALKHAHDHGIIHRDIKPANLLLTPEGDIKLSDFGIARLFGNTRVTSDGGVLGTAEYMAPEQADGRPVTDRCDQYSLGGVMYALLAGRAPFRASSLVEMLQLQRFAEPDPVRRYAADCPEALERIVMQLLEKDPQKRFVNTMLLGRALEAMEHGLSISASRSELPVGIPKSQPMTQHDPLAATLVPAGDAADADNDEYELDIPGTAATAVISPAAAETEPELESAVGIATSFTKVEEESHRESPWRMLSELGAPTTLGLLAAIALVLLAAWYALRPATADELYRKIAAAASLGSVEGLREADAEIREFVQRFPADARAAEVREYRQEIDLARSDRRMQRTARRLRKPAESSPVERAYIEALQHATTQPKLAMAKLQAVMDVYGGTRGDEHSQHFVELAGRELKRLEVELNRVAAADVSALDARLKEAARLEPKNPAGARRIWSGIVELYGDKPWAAAQVRAAREALARTTP